MPSVPLMALTSPLDRLRIHADRPLSALSPHAARWVAVMQRVAATFAQRLDTPGLFLNIAEVEDAIAAEALADGIRTTQGSKLAFSAPEGGVECIEVNSNSTDAYTTAEACARRVQGGLASMAPPTRPEARQARRILVLITKVMAHPFALPPTAPGDADFPDPVGWSFEARLCLSWFSPADDVPDRGKFIALWIGISPAEEPGVLQSLHLVGVGPADALDLSPLAPRLNLLTGDNGLGKTFFLDAAWWALTRSWAHQVGQPNTPDAKISHCLAGRLSDRNLTAHWSPSQQGWIPDPYADTPNVLVVYASVDGGFSVFDAVRNRRVLTLPNGRQIETPPAFVFTSHQALHGLAPPAGSAGAGSLLAQGLIHDWVDWQRAADPRFDTLTHLLAQLGPSADEPIRPGKPRRGGPLDTRLLPTISMPYGQEVPLLLAPAGLKRIALLAYILTWAMTEHRTECAERDEVAASKLLLLIDEPETHLHPRWQRRILPALQAALGAGTPLHPLDTQIMVVTHAPLVLASMEPSFDPQQDALWKMEMDPNRRVVVQRETWSRRGDVGRWLRSEVFDLRHDGSLPAEEALERAKALTRHPTPSVPEIEEVTRLLQAVLSDTDIYWRRWADFAARHGIVP